MQLNALPEASCAESLLLPETLQGKAYTCMMRE